MTKYGDICLIWFDTPGVMTKAQSQELYDLVKQYQPDCLVNSRLGNGVYDYVSLGDNEIPAERPAEISKERAGDMQSMNDLFGFKYSPYNLYETAATLNDTWGFKYYDHNWKTPEQILANKQKLNGMGVNYLLNVGPDALAVFRPIPSIFFAAFANWKPNCYGEYLTYKPSAKTARSCWSAQVRAAFVCRSCRKAQRHVC